MMNNKSLKELSVSNYKNFCELEGSDYIASEFALYSILILLKRFKIKRVLEVGLGIGSVSDTILKFAKSRGNEVVYYGTEQNDFCLQQLQKNVTNFNKINLFEELKYIPLQTFDLIIIDGLDASLNEIEKFTSRNCILFVEGDRSAQTKILKELFPKQLHVNVITLKKNQSYAHVGSLTSHYVGGGQLIFTNPTIAMKGFGLNKS